MKTTLPVVTLDGPAGVGKTTLAQQLAESLHVAYLDTGAMFRCLALKLGPGAETLPEEELREKCRQWTFSLSGKGRASTVCCNGVPIRGEVRTEQVGMLAARIATVPVVREVLREAQRAMGEATPLVVEGRDMGTVVFPDARFKFFLDASPEVRALRRLRDLAARGVEADLVTLTEQIRQRDSLDRNRAVAPLRPAADAVIVDTSELDIAGVLGVLVHRISVHEGSVTLLPEPGTANIIWQDDGPEGISLPARLHFWCDRRERGRRKRTSSRMGTLRPGHKRGARGRGPGEAGQTPIFLIAVGASGEAVCRESPPARLRGLRKTCVVAGRKQKRRPLCRSRKSPKKISLWRMPSRRGGGAAGGRAG